MLVWLKKNTAIILTVLITIGFAIYMFGCESKTRSLLTPTRQINRQELQLELDQIINLAQLRMIDLAKQERFKTIILENALILVQGQPFNPFGIITAIAAIYGVTQGGRNVKNVVKLVRNKGKENNG